jgi:polysaccharide chain length determinant protein (PEP-CTERM system associated)
MLKGSSSNIDIWYYLAILERRKYVALSVALVVISLCTWGSFFMPKVYEASSTVFVERSSILDPLIRGVGVSGSLEDRLRNLRDSITTRNIIERVVKKLGIDEKIKNSREYETLTDNIRKHLGIKVRGATDLFIISYSGKDPKLVRDVVNTLVDEYIEENLEYRRTDAYSAHEFIRNQLEEYKKKLDESDVALKEFREKNPQLIPQTENTLLGKIEGFQTAKTEADIRLKELKMKRENLQKQISGEKELTVAFVTRENSSQRARLNYLNNQLMLLMTKYTEDYPEVIKVKSEIEEIKKQIAQAKDSPGEGTNSETSTMNPIYQQLREEMVRTDAELESLKARSAELSRQQQSAQRILGSMPKEQMEWAKLQRDRNVYQTIYNDLLHKLENARVSKDLELADKTTTFRVVDPAILPTMPVKPDRVQMILLGLIFGIVSGIGAVFGLEYLDNSFKDTDSIETRLKLPVFATIPRIITEEDELSAKRLNRKVFTAAGAYLFVIGLVLAREILYRYMGIRIINF